MEKARSSYVPPPLSSKSKTNPLPRTSPRNSNRKRPIDDSGADRSAKRARTISSDNPAEADSAVQSDADANDDAQAFTQPALITGVKLKDYQLEGVAWMAGLYGNGISGILGTSVIISMSVSGYLTLVNNSR